MTDCVNCGVYGREGRRWNLNARETRGSALEFDFSEEGKEDS